MKTLIVSDFDGTINKKDLGEEFGRILSSYPELKDRFTGGKLGMPEVYRSLLGSREMSLKAVKDFYVEHSEIDGHFVRFLKFVDERDIAHIIVSDGFDLLIEATLAAYGIKDSICIFANRIRDAGAGNGVVMDFPFRDDDCAFSGVCKKTIIRLFRQHFDRIVYIGNGYSDIDAVPEADIVFARSMLKSYCNDNRIPSLWYEDYGDIVGKLGRSFKGVIFDLDGTLINSFSAIYESFNYTMRELGLPEYRYDDVLKTIGMPLEDVMAHVDGVTDPGHAVEIFRSSYEKHYLDSTSLLQGVRETVDRLHRDGLSMAVSTNKLGRYSRILLEHLGIDGYFRCVVGTQDGLRNKPYPDSIDRIVSELGLDREEVVYVGDSLVDAQTAGNAGVDFIGVSTGPTSFSELAAARPYVVLDSIVKLPVYIRPIG
ncbi:MAG: HAD family hydrolase [Deltaproteobacteria bacterium]|nr:HAD family hydrolase [Deltaproteobacteria bacterium]MCL5277802.1 HAD family hydrolase [Deltaproteobacteria bacterium]